MKFLDKLQESLYDIFGFIIPGLIINIAIYITIFVNNNASQIIQNHDSFYSPIESIILLISNNKLQLLNFELTPLITGLIVLSSFLTGNIINNLSKALNKHLIYIPIKSKLKDGDFCTELYNYLKECYKDDNIKEDFILRHARSLARIHNYPSLIQKYIAKYNFYLSITFLSFLLLLDSILFLFNNTAPCTILFILLLVFSFLARTQKCKFLIQEYIAKFNFFHLATSLTIFVGVDYLIFKSNNKIPSVEIFVLSLSFLSMICFYREFRRHYELYFKESCFVLYHHIKNSDSKDVPIKENS
ncbi:hypothetical protein [Oceanirhabdus sp. W0125-5]|uniref:hypothetical protein n=1 Tax=Oceanirhabdus sp. W0125-5 TaxID=2999116 RepID=UPI0022F2AED5|nr:hypothetical protein [Oceanirhabdus sp. W0125-5]WBW96306.1 hypothetical protein OW730_21820 [Oceanirhabdus sp. W0125-5]